MNIESRRIESRTATAVTSTMRPNAATGMIRSQRTRAAKKVEKRMAMADASMALAVTGYLRAAFQFAQDQKADSHNNADGHAHWRHQPSLGDGISQKEYGGQKQRHSCNPRKELYADEIFPVELRHFP